jgi:prevent-host-death family protein
MERFTSQDLQRKLGELQDKALVSPICITNRGRDRLVLLSIEEYERLKSRDRQSLAVEKLPQEFIDELRKPINDPELEKLNYLMEEDK